MLLPRSCIPELGMSKLPLADSVWGHKWVPFLHALSRRNAARIASLLLHGGGRHLGRRWAETHPSDVDGGGRGDGGGDGSGGDRDGNDGGDGDDGGIHWLVGLQCWELSPGLSLGWAGPLPLSRIPGFRLVVLIYFHKYNEEFRTGNIKDEIALGFCFCTVGGGLWVSCFLIE